MYNCVLTILTLEATDPCMLRVNGLCTYFLTFIDKYNNVYEYLSSVLCLDRLGLQEYGRERTKTYQMVLFGRGTSRRVLRHSEEESGRRP